jgi:hypothetical protein
VLFSPDQKSIDLNPLGGPGLTIWNANPDGSNPENPFLYAVPVQHHVTIFRQNWPAGKWIGQPLVALNLPFAFPLVSGGNAYDFSRDLSIIAYARPGGHADLYLLSQK